ncbi:MAG: peptidylprolyl isomerase [Clostridia bacterium]|nr:peptidylprolyl isomerase [Clostridia bacterium]
MKRLFCILLSLVTALALAGCGGKKEEPVQTTPTPTEAVNGENAKIKAAIEVEGFGVIELELYPDIAPQSVRNFCSLARQGFYDGTTFHRIINGFMIQGGDPTGTGGGGPGYCIKGEFELNGFKNDLKHTRGVISMARLSRPYNSAGCQFFIVHKDSPHLDGAYAAFGMVTSGMEVVDAIASVRTNASNRPYEDVVIKTVTITGPELPEPEKLPDVR